MRKEQVAYLNGYRINEEGELINPNGKKLVGYYCKAKSVPYRRFKFNRNEPDLEFHRLAAYQWFGDALFEEGIQVRHLDGNSLNNAKSNLAIGTRSQNAMDKLPEVRLRASRTAAAVVRKLTDEQVLELRKDRENGYTHQELSEKYGLSKSTISYIVNRRYYKEL